MRRVNRHAWAPLLVLLLTGGCASLPPPNEQLAQSEVAVRNADEAGARTFAPLDFRRAETKLAKARTAVSESEYETARRLAQQAEVDAELAQAKARATKAQKSVDELRRSIRTLQEEIERKSAP